MINNYYTVRAGSDVIETNTYQASIPGFVKYLGVTEEEGENLIIKSVELAKKAIDIYKLEIKDKSVPNPSPKIAGACGPYGAFLHDASEYTGSYKDKVSIEFIKDWHKPRFNALIQGGVDFVAFETIPCENEAIALIELLEEFPSTKAWLSFSCKDGQNLSDGTDFKEAVRRCYEKAKNQEQIIAVGVNCIAPQLVTPLIKGINTRDNAFIPLVVYPNSGEIYKVDSGWQEGSNVFTITQFIKEWVDLGVIYIGCCCRTTAEDIEKIRQEISQIS